MIVSEKLKNIALVMFLGTLITLVFLHIYGFAMANDSEEWLGVAKFFSFLPQISPINFSRHWLISPVTPYLANVIGLYFSSASVGYLLLNFTSYILSAVLVYFITIKLTLNKLIAFIAAVLFLIDFQTLHLNFAILADSVTWLAMLTLIYYSLRGIKNPVVWGLLCALAILVKPSLAFFFLLYPFSMFPSKLIKYFWRVLISVIITVTPALLYYFWLTVITNRSIWQILMESVVKTPGNFMWNHLVELFSSYLYLWPFIIVGLTGKVFKVKPRIIVTCLIPTLIPIFLWPWIAARFSYTTFWFFLPIAAAGILKITSNRMRIAVSLLIILCFLNITRNYLVLNRQTHWWLVERALDFLRSFQ